MKNLKNIQENNNHKRDRQRKSKTDGNFFNFILHKQTGFMF